MKLTFFMKIIDILRFRSKIGALENNMFK